MSQKYSELMTSRLTQLPADQQSLWKDFTRSVEGGNQKRIELLADKISSSDWYSISDDKKQTICISQMLFISLKEAYASPKTQQFEVFTAILPLFTGFLAKHAKIPELKDHPKLLMTLGEQFAVAFFDLQSHTAVFYDNFYEFHLQNVRDFLASPGFKGWRHIEGTDEFLKVCIARWLIHLGNFTRNRREKPFLNLLDLSLLLLRTIPELLPSFQGFSFVLPAAKKAFLFAFAGADDGILKVLNRTKQAAGPDLKPVIGEWIEVYNIGALPEVPTISEFAESPELTVPFVYRSLLEEIMGDGRISPDEEWIIKNMREHLEFPNDKYNKIFEQVQDARAVQKIKILDRDFSPREFLRKVLLKTIEDGVITAEEKNIIGKVANALLIDQNTMSEVFQEAKQHFQSGETAGPAPVSKELGHLHNLVRYTAMEERIRPVLISDKGIKVYNKAGKMLATLRQRALEKAGGKADEAAHLLGEWPVATFYFEPQTYLYPVLVLFVDSPNVHPARLEFKGGRIDVEFLEEVKSKTGEDTWIEDRQVLRLFNDGMGLEIPVKAVLVGDNLQNFLAGLEETKGKFSIMMMHHARMAPILALQKSGYLDVSGNLAQAHKLMGAGKLADAATLMMMINQGFPGMHEVLYSAGMAYEQLGQKDQAMQCFKREFELNGNSDKAMRGIARLLAAEQKWEDSLFWLKKAIEVAPASILNLTGYAETAFQRDVQQGLPAEIPEYVTKFLGEAWQIFPTHPWLVAKIEEIGKAFGIDLPAQFRALPVSTQYQ